MAKSSPTSSSSSSLQLTPVRDVSSLKTVRYGAGHEKYPSWPIPETSVAQVDPAGQDFARIHSMKSRSFADTADYDDKEKPPTYTRPYMKHGRNNNHHHHQEGLKTVVENITTTCRLPLSSTAPTTKSSTSSLASSLSSATTDTTTGCSYPEDHNGVLLHSGDSEKSSSSSSADFQVYGRRYANSEGYHSYLSTESFQSIGGKSESGFEAEANRYSSSRLLENVATRGPRQSQENLLNAMQQKGQSNSPRRATTIQSRYSFSGMSNAEKDHHGGKGSFDSDVESSSSGPKRSNSAYNVHFSKSNNCPPVRDGGSPKKLSMSSSRSAAAGAPPTNGGNKKEPLRSGDGAIHPLKLNHNLPKRNEDTQEGGPQDGSAAARPTYLYLDPQKKLRVADNTLKAIQKQALLSYYERHAGKPANVVSPSSVGGKSDSTLSSPESPEVVGLRKVHTAERDVGGGRKAEEKEGLPNRWKSLGNFKEPLSKDVHTHVPSIVATAVVAPMNLEHIRSCTDIPSSISHFPRSMSYDRCDKIETPPPKLPPKKPRPGPQVPAKPAFQTLPRTDFRESPPAPLPPRVPMRTPSEVSAGSLRNVVTFANPSCPSPELPLPPPPSATEGESISDEPLPPPPPPLHHSNVEAIIKSFSQREHLAPTYYTKHVDNYLSQRSKSTSPKSRKPEDLAPDSHLPPAVDRSMEISRMEELRNFKSERGSLMASKSAEVLRHSPNEIQTSERHSPPGIPEVEHNSADSSFDAPLPPSSAYFTISECKARLLTQYKDLDGGGFVFSNSVELMKQRAELVSRISRKLEILKAEQLDITEEIAANEQLGKTVRDKVESKARPNEFVKFRIHTEEIEKITSLLLGLTGRLARTENALMGLSIDNDLQEKAILQGKRDRLRNQLEEAKTLKENIDIRSAQVSGFLRKYLTVEEYEDYLHFMKMKAKLIMDAREIDDKIKLGEEQMLALQEALSI